MFAPGTGKYLLAALPLALVTPVLLGFRLLPWDLPWLALAVAIVGVYVFLAAFVRDPERVIGEGVVSAADGRIREVVQEGARWRISVFMNVTDVHVNRMPLGARVAAIDDSGSGFRPAYRVDANHNVQRRYSMETSLGQVEVVQMTGIIARRIISFVARGDSRTKGDRLGMILLGSRVDVLLPADRVAPVVAAGARVWAGRSTIARERS